MTRLRSCIVDYVYAEHDFVNQHSADMVCSYELGLSTKTVLTCLDDACSVLGFLSALYSANKSLS